MNGACVKATNQVPECPKYSRFDPVSYRCVCIDGYFPVGEYSCQKCSPNSYWDGNKCNNDAGNRCGQGYIWNGVFCSRDVSGLCGPNQYYSSEGHCLCKTGYFWISSQCQKCGYGTYFDGLKCVQYQVPQCNDAYKFWNGRGCVCLPDFFEYGDSCVRCPANTVWNGFCCSPSSNNLGRLSVKNGY